MKDYRLILIIGFIEILIGSLTVFSNFLTVLLSLNRKSPDVLLFVIIAGCISIFLGIGLIRLKKKAYWLLLYFSSVIVLSKLLLFLNVIQLNGALEVTLERRSVLPFLHPIYELINHTKNLISLGYHGFILIFFGRQNIRNIFHS